MNGGWDELLTAVLVGTDRRPLGRSDGGVLAALGPRPDALDAAAMLWAFREAGRLPAPAAAPPSEPSAPDGRPLPSPGAIAALRSILEQPTYQSLLDEWLALATGSGRRLPPEVVPTVFDVVPPVLRPLAAGAAGPLGSWLAVRNPDWAWARAAGHADADELERRWRHEADDADEVRLADLAALRAIDPRRAARLAAATWSRQPPARRLGILEVIATAVEPGDEALLEAALDDRRRDVRRRAATLLAHLPGSAWAARMAARAIPRVRVERRRLTLEYPTAADAAMVRDGIQPPPRGWREGPWWLRQLVAGTPLGAWEKALRRRPDQLVHLAASATEPAIALTAGWLDAAASQRNVAWARALLAVAVTGQLLAVLPTAEADAVVIDRLAERGLRATLPLLTECPASESLSRAVVDALAAVVTSSERGDATAVRAGLDHLARWLHPAAAEHAVVTLTGLRDGDTEAVDSAFWERPLGVFLGRLNFRHSLYAEFG